MKQNVAFKLPKTFNTVIELLNLPNPSKLVSKTKLEVQTFSDLLKIYLNLYCINIKYHNNILK